jgi:hypothetical protein
MTELDKITTPEIEVRVATYFGYRRNIVVPNISWGVGLHECDLLVVRDSGYGIEIEIKVSKSDLKADALKGHHHRDRQNRISELYFAIPSYLENCIEYIPEHAGVLIVTRYDSGLGVKMYRKAKINKNRGKFSEKEMLKIAHLGTMRIWNLKRDVNAHNRAKKKSKLNMI